MGTSSGTHNARPVKTVNGHSVKANPLWQRPSVGHTGDCMVEQWHGEGPLKDPSVIGSTKLDV